MQAAVQAGSGSGPAGAIESLLLRERMFILGGMAGLTAAGWAYLFYDADANHCARMAEMALPHMSGWSWVEFSLMFAMWSIMMVAMMVPSVAPMVLLFASINRRRHAQRRPYVPTAIFLGGYLAVWTGFSLLATTAQWVLQRFALLSAAMASTSAIFGGLILLAAGTFQWTHWKNACLSHCRTPLHFLMTDWKEGNRGAFRMGWRHGLFCTGCCWALMLLLFVAGVMNLAWVAALSALVLAEKVLPKAKLVIRVSGVALAAAGIWMLTSAAIRV
jgi:predicted metal-binding membrane protein